MREEEEWRGEVLLLLWCLEARKRKVVLTTATLSLIVGEGRNDVSLSTRKSTALRILLDVRVRSVLVS